MNRGEVLYVSVHVPKTGGMTLLDVLIEIFGDQLQRAYHPPRPGIPRSKSDGWPNLDNPACIHGHQVFGRFHETIIRHANTCWITFLRDPLKRAISAYYYRRRHRPWDRTVDAPPESASLEEFLLKEMRPNPYGYLVDTAGMPINEFAFVGITEFFDESMFLLYKRFDWDAIPYVKRNAGVYGQPAIGEDLIARFEARNSRDRAIYNDAKGQLEKRIGHYGNGFERDLSAFRRELVQYRHNSTPEVD